MSEEISINLKAKEERQVAQKFYYLSIRSDLYDQTVKTNFQLTVRLHFDYYYFSFQLNVTAQVSDARAWVNNFK